MNWIEQHSQLIIIGIGLFGIGFFAFLAFKARQLTTELKESRKLERIDALDEVILAFTEQVGDVNRQLSDTKNVSLSATERLINRMKRMKVTYGPVYEKKVLNNDWICPEFNTRCKRESCGAWVNYKCQKLMLDFNEDEL